MIREGEDLNDPVQEDLADAYERGDIEAAEKIMEEVKNNE